MIYKYFVVKWSTHTVCSTYLLWTIILIQLFESYFVSNHTFEFKCKKLDCICFIKCTVYVNNEKLHAERINLSNDVLPSNVLLTFFRKVICRFWGYSWNHTWLLLPVIYHSEWIFFVLVFHHKHLALCILGFRLVE
jgi:hypothetical protein